MSKRKRDDNGLVDTRQLDRLTGILRTISVESSSSLDPLIQFLNASNGEQVLQSWSFYSQTRNHPKLADTTSKLAWLVNTCNNATETINLGSGICREILDHHLKIVYRCLFIGRPAVTNAASSLLTAVAKFNKGALVNDMYSSFDLTLNCIPNILSDNQLRPSFLEFIFALLEFGSSIVRKDLMVQKKVVSSWIKNVQTDSEPVLLKMLKIFTDKICMDRNVLKSDKLSFFSDWILGNLVRLFTRKDSVPEQLSIFLTVLATDHINGIRFPDNGWYPARIKEEEDESKKASKMSQAQQRAMEKLVQPIYNKSLLSLLKLLKPWEDALQQKLVLQILSSAPELVSPYVAAMNEFLSFDPKLTSFWVSYASLNTKIIRLPIPVHMPVLLPPETKVVIDSILPVTISESALTKCLRDVPMIRYFAIQLIIASFEKFHRVKQFYDEYRFDTVTLTEELEKRLPDIKSIFACLQSVEESSEFLTASIYITINHYSTTFSDIFLGQKAKSLKVTEWDDISGIKLLNLHNALEIETVVSRGRKWWNKSSGANHSLFTTLLRFAASNKVLVSQVNHLLQKLLHPTLVFQDETLTSPVDVLLHSLTHYLPTDKIELDKMWNLMDESISRVMRAPYRYVDLYSKVAKKSSIMSSRTSPFIIALLDQWAYVDKSTSYKQLEKWLANYVRDSCICGENWAVANELAATKLECYVKFDGNEPIPDNWVDSGTSTFQAFLFLPESSLKSLTINSTMELDAAKFRILYCQKPTTRTWLFEKSLSRIEDMVREQYFRTFSDNKDFLKEYLHHIKDRVSDQMDLGPLRSLVKSIDDSSVWESALWLLDSDELPLVISEYPDRPQLIAIALDRLTQYGKGLNTDQYIALSRCGVPYGESLARNLRVSMNSEERLVEVFLANGLVSCATAVINSISLFKQEWVDAASHYHGMDLVELALAFIQCHSTGADELVAKAKIVALANLNAEQSLALLSLSSANLKESEILFIGKFIAEANYPVANTPHMVDLVANVAQWSSMNSELKKYTHRRILWLAKYFSERNSMTEHERNFLKALVKEQRLNIWNFVPKNYINDLITVLLSPKWISEIEIVDLVIALIFTAKNGSLEYTRHLQILLNIEDLKINDRICLLLYKLFCFDKSKHSNQQIRDKVILMFQGRRSVSDLLLLRILKEIESHLGDSWCNGINVWTLGNSSLASEQRYVDNNVPLIVQSDEGFELSLDIRLIHQTLKKGGSPGIFVPPGDKGSQEEWITYLSKYRKYYADEEVYSDEFLLFALVSCPEIYRPDGSINLKVFVECGGLSFILGCLASDVDEIFKAASSVVLSVLTYLSGDKVPYYRENTIIRLLLSKIHLYNDEDRKVRLPPCVFIFLGHLLLVLTNPGHHLYEKTVDYLLDGPGLREEIPVIKYIISSDSKDSFKDIQWGLDVLATALNSKRDLFLYEKFQVFEWAMTLTLSPFFDKSSVKDKVARLIARADEVSGGSLSLITRHATLAWSVSTETSIQNKEQKLRYLFTAPRDRLEEWTDGVFHDIY